MSEPLIDDSVTGIRAAQAAKMRVIGFLGGSHTSAAGYEMSVKSIQPDQIVHSMGEVSDLILAP